MSTKTNKTLVVLGHGVVGRAISQTYCANATVYVADVDHCGILDSKGDLTVLPGSLSDHVKNPDITFVCINYLSNAIDGQNLIDTVDFATRLGSEYIVLKSTLDFDALEDLVNYKFLVMPEWLTEAHSLKDFQKQNVYYHSGDANFQSLWFELNSFRNADHDILMHQMSAAECVLLKLYRNAALAAKVAVFNQFYEILSAMGKQDRYPFLRSHIISDSRIGSSHTQVPGPDGQMGFGGKCFPKDLKILLELGNNVGADTTLLKALNQFNNSVRGL
jgi:UDP-glucose 6-dehydrogenase